MPAADVRRGPGTSHPGEPYGRPQGNGNGGGGRDDRLRDVENRLTRIETRLENVASREWILGQALRFVLWALGISVTLAVGITFGLIRLFGTGSSGP